VAGATDVVGTGVTTFTTDDVDCGAADEATTLDEPDEPKFLDAVIDTPLLTVTLLTITTSPSSLVILTSTVVVPKPDDCSKKL